MKYRSLLLAFVCCFILLPAATSPLHADTTTEEKARHHKASSAKQEKSAHHAAPAKKKTVHRTIPATTQDEDAAPVNLGPVDPNHPPAVQARAVIVVDARSGAVLFEKNPDEPRPIASTTKLLTALIVAESGGLNNEVTVEPIDTICEPTKLYFRPGEHYARGALLYALLVHSCNDVARCLARDNAGSIESFADRMNARAAALGATDTHFVNPNGLPSPGEEQHSTARDLSKIARVDYANPVLRPIMATQHLQFQYADGKMREFANTNKVLLRFPLCNGMKTGYTDAAGHCLVSSADDGNHAVISVCLGDNKSIWNDSQRLLTWALAADAAHPPTADGDAEFERIAAGRVGHTDGHGESRPGRRSMDDPFQGELNALRSRSLHRRLRQMQPAPDGTVELAERGKLVNFSSNDYLGLADDPLLRDAAKAAIDEFGVGAGASRLVSGTRTAHTRLEEKLARFKGAEAALTFSSGYAAAWGAIGALMNKHDVLILDKLVHACLVDAARASGAILRVFPHNALAKLEDHLQWARREHPDARVLVLTEAVFSMDGDRAPLADLVELKKQHGALLLVDEAHAVGVIGKNGRGLAAELGVHRDIDIHMGTMSKALGVSGGYLCGRRSLIDLLVNRARSFIFSTAQPPALAAAAGAAVDFLLTDEGERRRLALWQNIRLLGSQLPASPAASEHADSPPPARRKDGGSAIFPWIVGGEADAVDYSGWLARKGFFAPAIRYPTVPKGAARLRLTVTARHRPEQIMALGRTLGELAQTVR